MESLVLLNPNIKKNEVKALQFFGKLQTLSDHALYFEALMEFMTSS